MSLRVCRLKASRERGMNIKHYNLDYLRRAGRCIGNLARLQRENAEPLPKLGETATPKLRQSVPHWSWKQSEVCGRHKLYRHINVPLKNGITFTDCHLGCGTVNTVRNVTGKHDTSCANHNDFYSRNNLTASQKRAKMSLKLRRNVPAATTAIERPIFTETCGANDDNGVEHTWWIAYRSGDKMLGAGDTKQDAIADLLRNESLLNISR